MKLSKGGKTMLTNEGLVLHTKKALAEKWGYVWGTFGQLLTEGLLKQKISQYPEGVGNYESFIRNNWLGRRTSDCVGLIKSYLWWGSNDPFYDSKTDVSANGMYNAAKEKGPISTILEIPGLCLWKDGHIGVYIGNGQVIEAHGTKFGVIKTPLKGVGATPWTHWLKCPYITYKEVFNVTLPEATKILKDKGIIQSPDYWDQNAIVGKTCNGDFVQQLIIKFAKEMK